MQDIIEKQIKKIRKVMESGFWDSDLELAIETALKEIQQETAKSMLVEEREYMTKEERDKGNNPDYKERRNLVLFAETTGFNQCCAIGREKEKKL